MIALSGKLQMECFSGFFNIPDASAHIPFVSIPTLYASYLRDHADLVICMMKELQR